MTLTHPSSIDEALALRGSRGRSGWRGCALHSLRGFDYTSDGSNGRPCSVHILGYPTSPGPTHKMENTILLNLFTDYTQASK